MRKILGLGVLVCGVCMALSGCDLFHEHIIARDEGRQPTCTESGLSEGSHCSDCGEVFTPQETIPATGHTVVLDEGYPATCFESGLSSGSHCSVCGTILSRQETIPATGHQFGNWVKEDGQDYRECSSCHYREVKGTNSGAGTVTGSYSNFDFFLRDCSVSDGSITYQGSENEFIVNLHAATKHCDNTVLYIPSRVTRAVFVGDAKGNPYQNFRIVVEERTNDIWVGFQNVRVESERTIFTSETRSINVYMEMDGVCTFLITSRGKDGKRGYDAMTNFDPGDGEKGEDGQDAMIINGTCEIDCKAASLEMSGGDAGNGGNGGTSGFLSGAAPGDGGDGGRGGNAILGENPVIVKIHEGSKVSLIGGKGGKGGKKGTATVINWNGWEGKDGEDGAEGESGCEIVEAE